MKVYVLTASLQEGITEVDSFMVSFCSKEQWDFVKMIFNEPEKLKALQEVILASQNLVKQKGRHNTEAAYKRLKEAVEDGEKI